MDGPANDYETFPSEYITVKDCNNECIRDSRCFMAIKDNRYCYLKSVPANPGPCGYYSSCWALKGLL